MQTTWIFVHKSISEIKILSNVYQLGDFTLCVKKNDSLKNIKTKKAWCYIPK